MRLRLVLKGPDRLMGAQAVRTLAEGSIVVGRAPTADWVLPDPNRVVSKAHCRIDKDISGFVLTDTSTNGIHINDEPVRFGLPRQIADGDVIMLGDAIVVAHIDSGNAMKSGHDPVHPAGATPPKVAHVPDGPFGKPENAPLKAVPAVEQDLGAPPLAARAAPSASVLDDWWKPEANAPAEGAKVVDISPQAKEVEIAHTNVGEDALTSSGGDVAGLISSMAGIDTTELARAVDKAVLTLSENDRQKFGKRLRELLNEG